MFARTLSLEVGVRCVSAEDARPWPAIVMLRRHHRVQWVAKRSFRYLSCKHFAVACWQPLKCWRCFGDFHLESKGPRKSSSTLPPSCPRPAIEVAPDVLIGSASRPRSYVEAVLAPFAADRSARRPDRRYLPHPSRRSFLSR